MTDHQQPLTETQALAWLHGQPDGTIATTVSDLAHYWGWNRSTTSRRVKVWIAFGQLGAGSGGIESQWKRPRINYASTAYAGKKTVLKSRRCSSKRTPLSENAV